MKMYLALFVASVDAGDLQTKLLAALLTGVARALPYARKGVLDASTSKELDALFGLAHAGTGPARVRALCSSWSACRRRRPSCDHGLNALYMRPCTPRRRGRRPNPLYC